MSDKRKRKRAPYHYSGKKSAALWKRVKATDDLTLYGLFCALQSVEYHAVCALQEIEEAKAPR